MKRAKYGNVKANGFDSTKEARRHADLVLLERAGKIVNLMRQSRYTLVVGNHHICDYVADFTYYDGARMVVEDVKSAATRKLPVYRIKKKLMAACLLIDIQEF